jgi:hypothetical protein
MNMISTGSFLTGTDATKEQDTLAGKFAAVWEKKNAKAARAGGVSLMALTLAACGSSSDDTAADAGAATDAATDEAATETTTTAMTALQSQAADLLTDATGSDTAVEAAVIAAASKASVMAMAESGTTAPATAAAAIADMTTAIANLTTAMETTTPLEAGNAAVDWTAILGGQTYALALAELTAVTAAEKTALATTTTSITGALAFEATSDAQTTLLATNAVTTASSGTAAQNAVMNAGLAAITSNHAAALLIDTINTDTGVAATAAEIATANSGYAVLLNNAVIAANETYATEWAALTDANQATILTDIEALITESGTGAAAVGAAIFVTRDAGTGAITGAGVDGATGAADAVSEHIILVEATIDASAGAPGTAVTGAGFLDTAVAGDVTAMQGYIDATMDQSYDAALIAAFNGVLADMQAIAAEENAGELAVIQAGIVATESLGANSIDMDGGAATDGNDVFTFAVESGASMTIGTAAAYLGESGTDSVVIKGDYTFVTITEAQNDTIATTALGSATALEIFVYQNATNGNTVLHVEENAFDGSLEANGALTTLTLTDVTFADLTQIDADGFTVLSTETAVA